MTTEIFDMFKITTLKQDKIYLSDPVLFRQILKKMRSDPVLIRPKSASVLIQSWSVLISRKHQRWSLETWSRSRDASQDPFLRVSVVVAKVSGLISV